MKKIFSFAAVMAFGIAVTFGQTAASSTTTESATPVIKVTDATGTVKCSTDSKNRFLLQCKKHQRLLRQQAILLQK
jgi:hypothetical protein